MNKKSLIKIVASGALLTGGILGLSTCNREVPDNFMLADGYRGFTLTEFAPFCIDSKGVECTDYEVSLFIIDKDKDLRVDSFTEYQRVRGKPSLQFAPLRPQKTILFFNDLYTGNFKIHDRITEPNNPKFKEYDKLLRELVDKAKNSKPCYEDKGIKIWGREPQLM